MASLIDTINSADRIANLWRHGNLPAINAQESITDLGFYSVAVKDRTIVAWLHGCRFEMPAA